jgi:predicted transposase YbfD/YdcC
MEKYGWLSNSIQLIAKHFDLLRHEYIFAAALFNKKCGNKNSNRICSFVVMGCRFTDACHN